jgi:cytochrome oxidase Cu insertion factor (SCO1/SenC/PrrC family)
MTLSPRTKFVLMFVLFAMPIVASYLMFFFWKPTTTNNFGELIRPVITLPEEKFDAQEGRDAPAGSAAKGYRGKWLIVTRDSGACDAVCTAKLYTMRQARLLVSKDLDRVARVMLIDDGIPVSEKLKQDFAGMGLVSAKSSSWLAKLPRAADDATGGRGYIYAVDPMGNLFMRYRSDEDIKELAADLRRVLKASQLGKDLESVEAR